MKDYILLALAALLIAVGFALSKAYQKIKGDSPKVGFFFNCITGLLTAVVFFGIAGFKFSFSAYSLIMAGLMSLFSMLYSVISFKLLKTGSMALYTLFLMTGGMTLPYLYGLMFLNEPFSPLRTVALVFILGGVILSNISKERADIKQILLCVSVFILNGLVSIVSKVHQIEQTYQTVSATEFVMLTGLCKFVMAGVLFLVAKKSDGEPKADTKKLRMIIALIFILSAVASGISYMFQLWGAESLPATVLYPFITGGSIVFSTLAGVLIFKDKLSVKMIISVALCFVGTLMFL